MAKTNRLFCLVVGFALLTSAGTAHASDDTRSFESTWSCEDTALLFNVEPETLQPRYVPSKFRLKLNADGTAALGVFAEDCSVTVDDGPTERTVLSGVIVTIENPDKSLGDSFSYDIHWGTNAPGYYKAMHRLNFGSLTPTASYVNTPSSAGIATIEADIDWEDSPYAFTVMVAEPAPAPVPHKSVHWAPAKHGFTRSTYPHVFAGVGAGEGELRVEPGTILHDILGTERATAPALLFRFTIDGAVTEKANL